jgi:hypothetical protein
MKFFYHEMDTILQFGKYKGETVRSVLLQNSKYVPWCLINNEFFVISDEVFWNLSIIKLLKLHNNNATAIDGLTNYLNLHNSKKLKHHQQLENYNRINNQSDDWPEEDNDNNFYNSGTQKYGGYNGFDDEAIDEAFDGDPEATWNVD